MLATEHVDLDSLRPHPRNARRGNVDAIARSLTEHGQYRPIVVNRRTMEIVAGNHTWRAAQQLGWAAIAVTYVDVDDAEALRILLIDNKLNDDASYDDAALADLLAELIASDGGVDGSGYDEKEVAKLLEKQASYVGDAETSDGPDPLWGVIVECANEGEQMELLAELDERGYKIRALMQ